MTKQFLKKQINLTLYFVSLASFSTAKFKCRNTSAKTVLKLTTLIKSNCKICMCGRKAGKHKTIVI